LSIFAGRSRAEEYLARYVVRECRRGRSLQDVLEDPYVKNRATPEERARLLDRPEVVAAVGEEAIRELRSTLARAAGQGRLGSERPTPA
jgi:hypothetical protein